MFFKNIFLRKLTSC